MSEATGDQKDAACTVQRKDAACISLTYLSHGDKLQCVAVCCSVLQCVAVCCSVLRLASLSHISLTR